MTKEEKLKKLNTFSQSKDLAQFEELQEVNENLSGIKDAVNFKSPDMGKELISLIASHLKGDKGEKGDQGETGPQGPQGEEGPQGPQGEAGKDGVGVDGLDGKDGKDGVNGADGKHGKDGSPDTAEQVRDKIASLTKENRLDISALKRIEVMTDRATFDRAIAILDQRSQVAVNRLSNNFVVGVNTSKITVSVAQPTNPSLNDLWVAIS